MVHLHLFKAGLFHECGKAWSVGVEGGVTQWRYLLPLLSPLLFQWRSKVIFGLEELFVQICLLILIFLMQCHYRLLSLSIKDFLNSIETLWIWLWDKASKVRVIALMRFHVVLHEIDSSSTWAVVTVWAPV